MLRQAIYCVLIVLIGIYILFNTCEALMQVRTNASILGSWALVNLSKDGKVENHFLLLYKMSSYQQGTSGNFHYGW